MGSVERRRPYLSRLEKGDVWPDDYGYAAIDAHSAISFVRIVAWSASICS